MSIRFPVMLCAGLSLFAQPPDFGRRGGFGPPGGPGGPGGFGQRTAVLEKFDKDGDGYLNAAERKAAREYLATLPRRGRGPGGPGGFGAGNGIPGKPGPKMKPADVKVFGAEALYDPHVVRTLFLEFDDKDWDKELADFYH